MDFILPESDGLRIEYFGHLFDYASECYKMFWFQVIVEKVLAGQTSASYEEIIDEMITDAWYMVAGGRLSEIVLPVYQSAKAAGFREWEYMAE